MTTEEVQAIVGEQSAANLAATNHRMTLGQAIVLPMRTTVVWRKIRGRGFEEEELDVWIVGQESRTDGYKIVMRADGTQFGLASTGFSSDKHLVLDGWYGTLLSTFLAM